MARGCLQQWCAIWGTCIVIGLVYLNSTFLFHPGAADAYTSVGSKAFRGGDVKPPVGHTAHVASQPQRSNTSTWEDNAPRPPARPGDRDIISPVTEILPGADARHLHGRVGLSANGQPLRSPTPLPPQGLTHDEKVEAHRGQCYNSRVSDSLPFDREQPDHRSHHCMAMQRSYPPLSELPTASVVMIFFNEIASILIRSVHSILNHSPPSNLKEIILVDDASSPEEGRFSELQWKALQEDLEDYLMHLPKVHLVRLGERRGLMLARMEGAWRSSGDIVIFLDSHIEATRGWLEPLLARIGSHPTHVVVPTISSIGADNFQYSPSGGLGVVSFTWTLGQAPEGSRGDGFHKSPIMAGGLFAANRAFFFHLGGYDPEMKFYGGEEMEIGFRTWQCGGEIELVPCSVVYHIFRSCVFWQGHGSGGVAYMVPAAEITRNKLRTAAVWMDEYAALVNYASPPLPKHMSLGNLTARQELRKKLKCKSFSWYLANVATDVQALDPAGLQAGSLENIKLAACVDSLGGQSPGLYPCHGQHGSQGLVMDGAGSIRFTDRMYRLCLTSWSQKLTESCSDNERQLWHLDKETNMLKSKTGMCLQGSLKPTDKSPYSLEVVACDETAILQKWSWIAW